MATEVASTAEKALGFTYSYKQAAGAYAEVHNLINLNLPNIDNSEVEKTHHGSPNRKREFGLTLGEMAPYDLVFHHSWDDPVHVQMYEDCFNLVETSSAKVEFPGGTKSVEGIVYLRNWRWGAMQPGNLQEATVTVRESPAWDWPTP